MLITLKPRQSPRLASALPTIMLPRIVSASSSPPFFRLPHEYGVRRAVSARPRPPHAWRSAGRRLEIRVIVIAAPRIEPRAAGRTDIAAIQVLPDAQLRPAG